MTYPINPDAYIAEVKRRYTVTEWTERHLCEKIIPIVNDMYQDGRTCPDPWKLDAADMIAHLEQKWGRPLSDWLKEVYTELIEWCNLAYERGQQDAKETIAMHADEEDKLTHQISASSLGQRDAKETV